MQPSEIIVFAKSELEAVPDRFEGNTYRCSVYLQDWTYLPCVLLVSRERYVEGAVRRILERIEDGKKPPEQRHFGENMQLPRLVDVLAASGNRVAYYDIARLEPSPYAIPIDRLQGLTQETGMGYTQFVGTMTDGEAFTFRTGYQELFFQMPKGYTGNDVVSIRPHESVPGKIYGDLPYFLCYVDGLDP